MAWLVCDRLAGLVLVAWLVGTEAYARWFGRAAMEPWVINDYERALSVYARSGFVGAKQVKRYDSSGQIGRRLLKRI